ncbi:MAG: GspH/FimT family pseudopilin [Legionella sp.]
MRSLGFSLLEALITLVVVTVLTGIAINSLGFFQANNEQRLIEDELVRVVQYAKMQALSLGHAVYVTPLKPHESNWAKGIRLEHINPLTQQPELLYEWSWHHPRWQLNWSGAGDSSRIVFAAAANHMISNGRFHLSDMSQQHHSSLSINRLGRIKVDG